MYRVLIGLGSLLLVAVWGGVALVHAAPSAMPDFVVEGIITEPDRAESGGMFTLTINTTDFSVKAFAVSLGENAFVFLNANTSVPGWTARATDDNPITGLPGTGGGVGTPKEYALYTACDENGVCGPLLGQGTPTCFDSLGEETACFTFSIFQMTSLPLMSLGIIAVDNTTGQEVTCIGRTGPEGCSLSSNDPLRCDQAVASQTQLWPPNHKLIPISIVGVTDPNNDAVTITVTEVTQDEPVNGPGDGNTSPDAVLQGATVLLRAERAGSANGRVYHVVFTADNRISGASCEGTVIVEVPPSRGRGVLVVDDGQHYISTQP